MKTTNSTCQTPRKFQAGKLEKTTHVNFKLGCSK